MVMKMNRSKTNLEIFRKQIERIKKNIITLTKEIYKLEKTLRKVNGENDKTALLKEIRMKNENLKKHRLLLDDLTYSFIRSGKYGSERMLKALKYKTREGYLKDNEDKRDVPSLETMVALVIHYTHYNSYILDRFYSFEYDKDGHEQIRRDKSVIKPVDTIISTNYSHHEIRKMENGIYSGIKHK